MSNFEQFIINILFLLTLFLMIICCKSVIYTCNIPSKNLLNFRIQLKIKYLIQVPAVFIELKLFNNTVAL